MGAELEKREMVQAVGLCPVEMDGIRGEGKLLWVWSNQKSRIYEVGVCLLKD